MVSTYWFVSVLIDILKANIEKMRKHNTSFLIANFFICVILWAVLVKLAYFFDIIYYKHEAACMVVFFIITYIVDFVFLLMLNIAAKKILIYTFIENILVYLIILFFSNYPVN